MNLSEIILITMQLILSLSDQNFIYGNQPCLLYQKKKTYSSHTLLDIVKNGQTFVRHALTNSYTKIDTYMAKMIKTEQNTSN